MMDYPLGQMKVERLYYNFDMHRLYMTTLQLMPHPSQSELLQMLWLK